MVGIAASFGLANTSNAAESVAESTPTIDMVFAVKINPDGTTAP